MFLRTLAIIIVAIKRLIAQQWLALALILGLISSIVLVMSIPLYADAVYYRILQEELTDTGLGDTFSRPPFAYMFRYLGSTYGPQEWEDITQLDTYLSSQASGALGLPHKKTIRYFKTDNFRLFPIDQVAYADTTDPLEWVNIGFISNFEEAIHIVEGSFPAVSPSDSEEAIEVLVSRELADEIGLQIGEQYMLFRRIRAENGDSQRYQTPVRITGVWEPIDLTNDFWFYNPSTLETLFVIPEQSYHNRIAPVYPKDVNLGLWYLVMDGSDVTSSDVGRLLVRGRRVEQRVTSLLANSQLSISPLGALRRYQRASGLLTTLLYAFSVPIIGLLLAFIGLVVGLAVARQQNEVAVLRSRGATVGQVAGISGLEAVLLGILALAISIPISFSVADLIGSTRSFLNFTIESDLRLVLTRSTLQFGIGAVLVAFLAQTLPTFRSARYTIVTYKMESARSLRPPWWQRSYLDILLLIPAGYGIYLLQQQGSISVPGTVTGDSVFQNPLLFLIPALGIFALTLVTLRVLPVFMRIVAWFVSKSGGVGVLLASRHLARNRSMYTAPMILLVLTLSLSAFTTSLAQTLDGHLYDRAFYKVGAAGRLVELGDTPTAAPGGGFAGESGVPSSATAGTGSETVSWTFVPVSEHLRVPSVQAATRFARFEARVNLNGRWQDARIIGLDRIDFPKTAYWRPDFAAASLGSLMNSLALASEGILVPREFMQQNNLIIGDTILVGAARYGLRAEMLLKIVGDFRYFPTWYPDEGPLIVGNLDHLFEQMGGQFPYDVLVRTVPRTDYESLTRDLREYDINVLNYSSAHQQIAEEQRLPERQGLFGVLSVGFLAAALLTVLGFLLYTLFSFRRRFIELGTLRAIGLSSGQMTTFLAWELAFLILVGIGAGTLLGASVSNQFIPYLQVGNSSTDLTPPFLVGIAWPAITRVYALFGILFIAALGILVTLLMRMKIFQAIKLGETV